jgi:hypothetical protein
VTLQFSIRLDHDPPDSALRRRRVSAARFFWSTSLASCLSAVHLEPWHPDIECRKIDIDCNIRYRRLRYRMLIRSYRRFLHSISYVDIEGIRYRRSHYSISKLKNRRYRRSRTGLSISKFRLFDIEHTSGNPRKFIMMVYTWYIPDI